MAFDPTKPVEDSPLDAAEMRDQLNALKAIIDGLQSQFDGEQTQIINMNSSIADLQDAVSSLQGNNP
jgi:hypothetical protein